MAMLHGDAFNATSLEGPPKGRKRVLIVRAILVKERKRALEEIVRACDSGARQFLDVKQQAEWALDREGKGSFNSLGEIQGNAGNHVDAYVAQFASICDIIELIDLALEKPK